MKCRKGYFDNHSRFPTMKNTVFPGHIPETASEIVFKYFKVMLKWVALADGVSHLAVRRHKQQIGNDDTLFYKHNCNHQ